MAGGTERCVLKRLIEWTANLFLTLIGLVSCPKALSLGLPCVRQYRIDERIPRGADLPDDILGEQSGRNPHSDGIFLCSNSEKNPVPAREGGFSMLVDRTTVILLWRLPTYIRVGSMSVHFDLSLRLIDWKNPFPVIFHAGDGSAGQWVAAMVDPFPFFIGVMNEQAETRACPNDGPFQHLRIPIQNCRRS